MNKVNNFLYTGDNLHFLHRLDTESVDLIYLDPPFNSKRTYSAPIGSKAAGTSFKDMWSWDDIDERLLDTLFLTHPCLVDFIKSVQGTHGKPMMAYVLYMAQRIKEMHRVLKPTGSIYLHCDPTASHYLKIVMDKIFGRDNFRREVIWQLRSAAGYKALTKNWVRGHDTILYYTKGKKFVFNKEFLPYDEKQLKRFTSIDEDGRKYKSITKKRRLYLDEAKGVPVTSVWFDVASFQTKVNSPESTGYPTQKPLELLTRIIKASSNEGDLVLDPFCGCATTCVAAQQLNRKWIGIDIEEQAVHLLLERLGDDAGLFKDFVHTFDFPERTDLPIESPSKPDLKQAMFEEQGGKCNACENEMRIVDFHIDHIIPVSKGGSDTRENYQLLCGNCNMIKGNRPMEYLRSKIAKRDNLLSQQITFGK